MNTRDKDPKRIKKVPSEQGKKRLAGRTRAKRAEARKRAKP